MNPVSFIAIPCGNAANDRKLTNAKGVTLQALLLAPADRDAISQQQ
ncbi:hypothetical protein [Buttiauxella sp. B2]|nr:hypothetical protein [Buttiauxella sp. B2]